MTRQLMASYSKYSDTWTVVSSQGNKTLVPDDSPSISLLNSLLEAALEESLNREIASLLQAPKLSRVSHLIELYDNGEVDYSVVMF